MKKEHFGRRKYCLGTNYENYLPIQLTILVQLFIEYELMALRRLR
jgi:hypothetical protein